MSLLKLDPEAVTALAKELAPLLFALVEEKLFSNQTQLLNVEGAAKALNVSISWLTRRTSQKWQDMNGAFPLTKIGKSVRFSAQNLADIRSMKCKNTNEEKPEKP